MLKKILSFSIVVSAFVSTSLFAQEAPDALVKRVSEDILASVRQDKDIQSGNTKKAIALVEAKALSTFQAERMTALAMGRNWSKASPEQKKKITGQ